VATSAGQNFFGGDAAPALEIRQGSIGDRVYEALLSQMISLKIAPGSRISIDALAREFGVSQTPIRAALIRLEAVGLVEKTHNVGYSA
jgi:DNA-binding GntR family transcriptional regulator